MLTTVRLLEFEEGYRSRVYCTATGYPTIGIGKKSAHTNSRCLILHWFDVPKSVAYAWLEYDLQTTIKQCQTFKWFNALNQRVKTSLCQCAISLGFDGVLQV